MPVILLLCTPALPRSALKTSRTLTLTFRKQNLSQLLVILLFTGPDPSEVRGDRAACCLTAGVACGTLYILHGVGPCMTPVCPTARTCCTNTMSWTDVG